MRSGYAVMCGLVLAIGCGDGAAKSSPSDADAGGAGGGSSTGRLGDGETNGSRGESTRDGGEGDGSSDLPSEPIATLHGVVTTSAGLESTPELSVAIMWRNEPNPPGYRFVIQRGVMESESPESFSLKLYEPPPAVSELVQHFAFCDGDSSWEDGKPCDGLLVPAGMGLGYWIGFLVAIDARVPDGEISLEDLLGDAVLGIDTEHRLYYFNHPRPYQPESSKLTAQELLWTWDDYPELDLPKPTEVGYVLAQRNPDWHENMLMKRACRWDGLCVHEQGDDPLSRNYSDWSFERCRERFPENPTCNAWPRSRWLRLSDPDDEPAWSRECREQFASLQLERDCNISPSVTVPKKANITAPDGLAEPLTIQFGRGYWDAEGF